MANTLQQAKPRILLADEGESFQFFDLTFTRKMSGDPTHSGWVMNEITAKMGTGAPLHSHPWSETFYILDGQVEV
jgi:quercetin dioxygenase-like cupin family protein